MVISLPQIAGAVYSYTVLPSTQDEAKRLLSGGCRPPFVVIAERQTAGRGRLNRSWASPEGGIYLSWVDSPPVSPAAALVVGVALAKAIRAKTKGDVVLKWPNDVLLGGGKVAGILLETFGNAVVVGVGVNTFPQGAFGDDEPPNAACLPLPGREKAELLRTFFEELSRLWRRFRDDGFAPIREEYMALSFPLGTPIRVVSGDLSLPGRFAGVDDEGRLLLACSDGEKRFAAGEVSLRTQ